MVDLVEAAFEAALVVFLASVHAVDFVEEVVEFAVHGFEAEVFGREGREGLGSGHRFRYNS